MSTDTSRESVPEKNSSDAVVNAFSKSYDSEDEFRARWKATVEEAKKRKEKRLLELEKLEKLEAERKSREEHPAAPRVSDERAGIPMDLAQISAAAEAVKRRAASSENEQSASEKPEASAEPQVFAFDRENSEAAETELAGVKNVYTPNPVIRDRRIRKNISEKLRFYFRTHFSKDGIKRFAARNFPIKGDAGSEITRKLIRLASLVLLVGALGFLINYGIDFAGRINDTNAIVDEVNSLANIEDSELEEAWAQIKAQYSDITFPEGMNIKWSKLYATNQRFVGWLKVPGTKIDTALLQADNNTYHLKHNLYNEYTRFGNPFVHYECNMGRDGLSKNTILYGHNANDGLMFHDLINYMTVEGYKEAPIVELDTLYEHTEWKIFAVVLTNSNASEDNGYVWRYLYPEFNSEAHFLQVLSEIDERTIIHTGVDVQPNDKIITLYTCCTYQLDSGRLAVFARQLRPGESRDIDMNRVYYNADARYPQEWYNRRNKRNPYAAPTQAAATTEQRETGEQAQPTAAEPAETPSSETAETQNGETAASGVTEVQTQEVQTQEAQTQEAQTQEAQTQEVRTQEVQVQETQPQTPASETAVQTSAGQGNG